MTSYTYECEVLPKKGREFSNGPRRYGTWTEKQSHSFRAEGKRGGAAFVRFFFQMGFRLRLKGCWDPGSPDVFPPFVCHWPAACREDRRETDGFDWEKCRRFLVQVFCRRFVDVVVVGFLPRSCVRYTYVSVSSFPPSLFIVSVNDGF